MLMVLHCLLWLWQCLCWASAMFVSVPVISDRPERRGRGPCATTYPLHLTSWPFSCAPSLNQRLTHSQSGRIQGSAAVPVVPPPPMEQQVHWTMRDAAGAHQRQGQA